MAGLRLLLLVVMAGSVLAQERARVEVPYQGGTLAVVAERIFREPGLEWVAEGDVEATYEDITLRTQRLVYDPAQQKVFAEAGIELIQGIQWLRGTRGEFNLADRTGQIENAEGFTDEEIFVKAKRLLKTGPRTYVAEDGLLTSCGEAVPKWSFRIRSARIHVDSWAKFSNTVFRVKKVPVFYLPYVTFPTGKKERSSGFMMPTIGNSDNKGRRITESFYLVLGRSADVEIRGDYFSERGFGWGVNIRARPNASTFLDVNAYSIDDRLDQGGTSLVGTAETRFGNGFRLAADFNLVTNFVFRRVFSDSFFAATRPTEDSRLFLTRNFGTASFNILASQQETIFPQQNIVTRSTPAFNFKLSGQRLFQFPLYLDLDATAAAVSRRDNLIETPVVSQRLDFQPRLYLSIPLFQGLRLTPQLAVRETFYSDSLYLDEDGTVSVSGSNLNRQYWDLVLDLSGWGLSKIYSSGTGGWKHLIEPRVRYRYTSGIKDFHRIIRYDENDAIADTNEIEFSLFNRFLVRETTHEGTTSYEKASFMLGWKYFLDPDFGGAWIEGSNNHFFPLYTFTGFPYGSIRRYSSPLTAVTRWNPSRRVSFDVHGDWDFEFNRFRNLSVTGFFFRGWWNFATTYFLTQELEPGTQDNNQLQGHVWVGNRNRGLSASALFSYDAREKDFLHFRTQVNYFWDCCGVAAEFRRLSLGLRDEREFRFAFFLKGLGAFGTIRRLDSIF